MPPILLVFIAEIVIVLGILAGILYYAANGSRDLQDRLVTNSKALNRYIKHLLSPEYKEAEEGKLRSLFERAFDEERLKQRREMHELRIALEQREQELSELRSAFEELPPESAHHEPAHDHLSSDQHEAVELLEDAEAELAEEEERQLVFHEELQRLKMLVELQEKEIERLQSRLDTGRIDSAARELLDARQRHADQQQSMMREMEMCIQVLETELHQTREKLALAIRRLSHERGRSLELATRLRNLSLRLRA